MMKTKILLSPPHIGTTEIDFVNQAFSNNWLTSSGDNVNGFEDDLELFYQSKRKIVALNSGTSAIHLALIKANVKSGDEVLCQSFTFCGSVNPVKYLNAKPVFIDSELDTFNICPIALKDAIEDRLSKGIKPKAIIIVHLYGMPAKMDALIKISKTYNIPIIEDAAEALGSEYKNSLCGALTTYGVLSFNGNKVITTTSGGALLIKTQQEKESVIHLASQAKDNASHYQHSKVGYNYRLSNVLAGIGRGQMLVLDSHLQKLQSNHVFYSHLLKKSTNLTLQKAPSVEYKSNYWLNVVLVNPLAKFSNNDVINHLSELEIESRLLWKPMHLQPVFKDELYFGESISETLFSTGLCLPSGSNLTIQDKERIKQALKPFI